MADCIKLFYNQNETLGRTVDLSSTNELVATLGYIGAQPGGGAFDGATLIDHIRIECGQTAATAMLKLFTEDGKPFDLDIVNVNVKVAQAGADVSFGSIDRTSTVGLVKLVFGPPQNTGDVTNWSFQHKVPTVKLAIQVKKL